MGPIAEEYNKANGKQQEQQLGGERFFAAFLLRVIGMADGIIEERGIHFRYFIFGKGLEPFPKIKFLAALVKATEMTNHTAFLKADGLSAFRAFFSHKAVLAFVVFFGIFTG